MPLGNLVEWRRISQKIAPSQAVRAACSSTPATRADDVTSTIIGGRLRSRGTLALGPPGDRTRVAGITASTYTSFTFFSGRLRTGLPVAAWIALSTAGATTQIVGSPTPPQKS
jgi:hypothetical protein